MSDKTQKWVIKKKGCFYGFYGYLFFILNYSQTVVHVLVERNEFIFNGITCHVVIKSNGVKHRRQFGWIPVMIGRGRQIFQLYNRQCGKVDIFKEVFLVFFLLIRV